MAQARCPLLAPVPGYLMLAGGDDSENAVVELTSNERKALTKLDIVEWENSAQLYVGAKTIASLLERGFIDRLPPVPSGTERFSITDAGRAAVREPVPKKTKSKSRLKTLPDRIPTLNPRLK